MGTGQMAGSIPAANKACRESRLLNAAQRGHGLRIYDGSFTYEQGGTGCACTRARARARQPSGVTVKLLFSELQFEPPHMQEKRAGSQAGYLIRAAL